MVHHDGQAMVRRLWETVDLGVLVWCNRGVEGYKAPADLASGRVPCRWVDPNPLPSLNVGGVIRGEYLSVMASGEWKGRQLIVRAPDGLLEVKTVMVYDELRLV